MQERNSFIRQLEDEKDKFARELLQYEAETMAFKNHYDVEHAEEVGGADRIDSHNSMHNLLRIL